MTKQLKSRTIGWGYTYLQTDADRLWFDEGLKRGWRLPAPAPAWKRRWGPRHWRWFWRNVRLEIAYRDYAELGITPPGRDGWVLYAVGRGWI